jgi:hypothetical protein
MKCAFLLALLPVIHSATICPGLRDFFVVYGPVSYDGAEQLCEANGGVLANIYRDLPNADATINQCISPGQSVWFANRGPTVGICTSRAPTRNERNLCGMGLNVICRNSTISDPESSSGRSYSSRSYSSSSSDSRSFDSSSHCGECRWV